jgi:Holliday junction DNA helicase RuvA
VGGLGAGPATSPATAGAARPAAEDAPLTDAIEALIALGYRPMDANRMARAADDGAKTSEEIIRAALRGAAT